MTDTPIKSPLIRRRRGIFTVGQEQHHRRGEGTNLQRRLPASNALSSKAVWSIGNVSPAIATSDVPPLRLQPIDGCQDLALLVGWLLHDQATVAKGDHTDLDRRRLLFDKGTCCGLGRFNTRWIKVISRHAVGDIKGEDHRALDARQRDIRLGPRQPQEQKDQRNEEEAKGQMTPPPQRLARGCVGNAQRP